jgi:flagella basal body P-ring formation protein FlgA
VLGAAPAPGDTITVQAAQLAAIARDYGVDWRPESGAERIVVQRLGTRLAQAAFLPQLQAALAELGAPADGDISLPGFDPPMLPVGATPVATITEGNFDPASGRFTARLSVVLPDGPAISARLGGQVQSVVLAAVLTHPVRPGTVLLAQDLRAARVHAGLLRGNVPISPEAALGQALRHAMPPGEPLTASDVTRPILVARNSAVHMRLDAGVINLSAQGVALEDGGIGQTVRVQNPSSRVVVMATVLGAGEVRVVPQSFSLEVAAQ